MITINNNSQYIKWIYQYHPHNLTENSPIPILIANTVLSVLIGIVIWFNEVNISGPLVSLGLITTVFSFILWFKDITIEGTFLGNHTKKVQESLSIGVSLFIVTEACVFLSVFWAYFHSSLSPTVELGTQWPPVSIVAISPMTIPLFNTLLLLSSGSTVTYAHHCIFNKDRSGAIIGLILTIILALVFTGFQAFEYIEAGFTISDGAYGSCFFFSTGLHGAHILVGSAFLIVGLVRLYYYHFTDIHHLGLESSIVYWHL